MEWDFRFSPSIKKKSIDFFQAIVCGNGQERSKTFYVLTKSSFTKKKRVYSFPKHKKNS